jgi:hypothetical protein
MKELTSQVAEKSIDAEVKSYICFGGCDIGPNIVAALASGGTVSRLDSADPALKEIVFSLLDAGVF